MRDHLDLRRSFFRLIICDFIMNLIILRDRMYMIDLLRCLLFYQRLLQRDIVEVVARCPGL